MQNVAADNLPAAQMAPAAIPVARAPPLPNWPKLRSLATIMPYNVDMALLEMGMYEEVRRSLRRNVIVYAVCTALYTFLLRSYKWVIDDINGNQFDSR